MDRSVEQTRSDRLIGELAGLAGVDTASTLLGQVRALLEENEGLADEVLRGYEQLNLIFDFTHEVAAITNPDEIVTVLAGRLTEMLGARLVQVVGADAARRVFDAGEEVARYYEPSSEVRDPALREMIERAGRLGSVVVGAIPGFDVLAGPLKRLNGRTDIVVLVRDTAAGSFTSGNVLLVESVLAFAGQLVSNSELHEQMRRMSMETTRALVAAIDAKDNYTSGHSERVGRLSRLIGRELRLSIAELHMIEMAGLLHDVGKIGVPEEILRKPGRLTDEEYRIIQRHPEIGYEILKPIASLQNVLDGVLYHHENPDGSGYPAGLKGDAIPMFARIIHVVDVFDALCSHRSYRPAYDFDRAIAILKAEAGTKLDRDAVAAFLRVFDQLVSEGGRRLAEMYGREGGT